jgi:hypothetical protein
MDAQVNVPIPEVDPKDHHAIHSPQLIIIAHQNTSCKTVITSVYVPSTKISF